MTRHLATSRRWPALSWISSNWHSEHWAEITLCHIVSTISQCFVLIKQSESSWPLQFWASLGEMHWIHNQRKDTRRQHLKNKSQVCRAAPNIWKRRTFPTLRANPSPEVTDQVCRLPSPTSFHNQEAANLGDQMRIPVRLNRCHWS